MMTKERPKCVQEMVFTIYEKYIYY